MKQSILIFVIIIIIALFIINRGNFEYFGDTNPNMTGYEEGMPAEYRFIDYQTIKRPSWNKKEFEANNWHLRLPDLVSQRYSYNDQPCKKCFDRTTYNYAKLKELPLDLRNFYYATMPFELAQTSLEYYPDVSNRRYETQKGPNSKCCRPGTDKGPTYTSCSSCRNAGPQTVVDISKKASCKEKLILGYDYINANDAAVNAGSA